MGLLIKHAALVLTIHSKATRLRVATIVGVRVKHGFSVIFPPHA
jgi:hypothetical protein